MLRTLVIAMLVFAAAGFAFSWKAMTTSYKGYDGLSTRVEIRKGMTSSEILRLLEREGVLRDSFVPIVYVKTVRRDAILKAGTYDFLGAATPLEVISLLERGEIVLTQVTMREGLDRWAVAELMVAQGLGTLEQWSDATAYVSLIADLAPEAESLEGYLFPDTYRFSPDLTPLAIVEIMVRNFRSQFGQELAYINTGLDVHETVTLASIVETEARLDSERATIASVYLNRIRKGMILQADPTVIFAMKLAGTWNGNIRKGDLRIDSPYNTYINPGLPPGPVASPGLASLRAAAAPTTTDYLFFVSKNDGSHVFSRTLAEHNHAVNIHQKEYWRNRRARQRAESQAPSPER
jgi:UPF0755 protein